MLLACGGGGAGSAALTWGIGALAVAVWVAIAALIVKTARDRRERRLLIGLLVLFVVIGPLVIAAFYAGGFFGSDGSLGKLSLVMLIPPAIAAVAAQVSGAGHGLRAFLVSAWGSIFLVGATLVLLIAAFTVGDACLE